MNENRQTETGLEDLPLRLRFSRQRWSIFKAGMAAPLDLSFAQYYSYYYGAPLHIAQIAAAFDQPLWSEGAVTIVLKRSHIPVLTSACDLAVQWVAKGSSGFEKWKVEDQRRFYGEAKRTLDWLKQQARASIIDALGELADSDTVVLE